MKALARLRRLLGSRLAGNTAMMAAGTAGRLLLQIGLFIVLARMLGPGDFGAFVSVTALIAIISTFAGLSGEIVLVKTVARDRGRFGEAFGSALILLALTTPVLVGLSLAATALFLGSALPLWLIACIALGDLLFLRINLLCAACFQAVERVGWSAVLNLGLGLCRLLAALAAAFVFERLDLAVWGILYSLSAVLAAALSVAVVLTALGRPRWRILRGELGFGAQASLQSTLYFTLRDIDKPLLVRLASLEATGLYAAAFRITDAAVVPIRALMYSAFARFFRQAAGGMAGGWAFALRLLPIGLGYGCLAGIGIAVAPVFVPFVLGEAYREAGQVLQVLALLPLLHAAYNIGADALSASGHQGARSLAHLIAAACMVGACLILIPQWGALGAAIANVASHAVLAAATWAFLVRYRFRLGRPAGLAAAQG